VKTSSTYPIVDRVDGMDPEHEALLADSVGLALLVVLETLSPPERVAFVLHDIFTVPFDEIAPIVDRSPEAARQLASRARRRVQGESTLPDADLGAQRRVVDAFLAAAREGTAMPSRRAGQPAGAPSRLAVMRCSTSTVARYSSRVTPSTSRRRVTSTCSASLARVAVPAAVSA